MTVRRRKNDINIMHKGGGIRFTETVDPKALEALESRGWKVRDSTQDRLLKKQTGGAGG